MASIRTRSANSGVWGFRYPQQWAADLDRRFLARTVHLFTKLAFAALLEISGMRYKVAVQIKTYLRTLPTQDTEHIPRLMHAENLRVHADPQLPQEEVQMLVMKLVTRSPNVTTTIEGKVKRLLGRRDQRVYLTWLEQKEKDQKITQPRLHELLQEFNRAPL